MSATWTTGFISAVCHPAERRPEHLFQASRLPPGPFFTFSLPLFSPNALMQTFYVFTYLTQSGSSWFVFKVPSELPLVCVLRITNDYGPLVPKCVPDG